MKRVFCVISIYLLLALPCYAGISAKREVKKGNLLYNKGKFDESLKRYEKAFRGAPDSEIVNFDLGAALYKLKDYEGALEHFKRSLVTDEPSLQQKANYNLGSAEYKSGISKEDSDLPWAVALLQEALRHYEKAIMLDIDDEDAKYNYEFVKEELKRLREKLKQQQEQQKQQQEKEEKESQGEKEESQQQQKQQEQQQQQAQEQSQQEKERLKEKGAQQQAEEEEKEPGEEGSSEYPIEKMSEKEAIMLLESYSQEEEPRGLYKERIELPAAGEVIKDW